MLNALTNLIVRVADLIEAEARAAKRGVVRLSIGLLLLLAAAIALLTLSIMALAAALYLGLALGLEWSHGVAMVVSALVLLAAAGACGLIARTFLIG